MKKIVLNENKIKELYHSNNPANIAKILGVSKSTIIRNLKKLGIHKNQSEACRKYTINHNYFSNIDHPNKAYWLGFILADGCVTGNMLKINLANKDENHLKKFLNDLNSNYLIKKSKKNISSLVITSEVIANDLKRFGIISNDKKIILPDDVLARHYWRGVIDGDGTISRSKNIRKNGSIQYQPLISLVGSEETCQGFLDFCKEFVKTKATVRKEKKFVYRFRLHGPKASKITQILYSNSERFLDRKKEKVQIYLDKSNWFKK